MYGTATFFSALVPGMGESSFFSIFFWRKEVISEVVLWCSTGVSENFVFVFVIFVLFGTFVFVFVSYFFARKWHENKVSKNIIWVLKNTHTGSTGSLKHHLQQKFYHMDAFIHKKITKTEKIFVFVFRFRYFRDFLDFRFRFVRQKRFPFRETEFSFSLTPDRNLKH